MIKKILVSPGRYRFFLALAVVLIALDQWTKHLAYQNLLGHPPIDVLPFLQWALVFNRGAAFGFLNDAGGFQHYLFSGLAVAVSAVLLVWLWREVARNLLLSWALALILAGAVGNLIDRVRYQFVIDFINLHYHDWYFPAFNIADMAITFGAIIFLIDAFGWFQSD